MQVLRVFVLLSLTTSALCRDLLVGAFNIQIFGKTKAKKTEVMDILVKIVRRYDLILIQEIRDSSPDSWAINQLLSQVNEEQSDPFEMVLSDRLGRSISKEQYAYFYRPSVGLKVLDEYVYFDTKMQDGKEVDLFERQPYVVEFSSSKTELGKFGLIGIHVDPDKAVEEINDLHNYVFDDVKVRLREPNLMVLGDLNADCNYVSESEWKTIPMKTDPNYSWLIGDEIDTTVKGSHCAYDRFITTGHGWDRGIVPGSARVYRFDQDKTIGEMDQALTEAVSDHYPIEFLLAEKQFVIIEITNRVYMKLGGAYSEKGSLSFNDFYPLRGDASSEVLHAYSVSETTDGRVLEQLVGELNSVTSDEQLLTEVLIELLADKNLKIKMYMQPYKNRYRGRQNSNLFIAVPATDEQEVTLVWNILNTVCEKTYLKCSKDTN